MNNSNSNSSIRESINIRESICTNVSPNSIGPAPKQQPNQSRKSNIVPSQYQQNVNRNSNFAPSQQQPISRNSYQAPLQQQNSSKDLKKETILNKSGDKNFIKLYEENLDFKQKQADLIKEVKDLKERLNRK